MKIVEREIKGRKGCDKRHDVSCRMPHRASGLTSRAPWPKVKLEAIGKVITGMTPPTKHQAYYGDDYLFVTPSDLGFDSYFISKTERCVSQQGYEKYRNRFIPAMSTMYTCIGSTIGKIGLSRETVLTNQQINSIIPNDAHDARFVYYLMRSLTNEIRALNAGCAVPIINKGDFENIDVPLVPLPVQRRIADILSAYDDLIENNRRRIAILEETARLAYRKWFCGAEQGRTATLGEIAPFVRGKVITQKNAVRGKVPVVAGGLDPAYFHNMANTGAPVITISGSGANAGFTRMYFEPIWASDCSWCDKSKTKCFYFVYCFLKDNADALRNLQQGAAQPHVYPRDINALEVALPKSDDLLGDFEEVVEPLFSQCGVLAKQNATLAAARDMLLPRLMKGNVVS